MDLKNKAKTGVVGICRKHRSLCVVRGNYLQKMDGVGLLSISKLKMEEWADAWMDG